MTEAKETVGEMPNEIWLLKLDDGRIYEGAKGFSPGCLYTRAEKAAVTPGYVLVPIEPNKEMIQAGLEFDEETKSLPMDDYEWIWSFYRAMLAAAPPQSAITEGSGRAFGSTESYAGNNQYPQTESSTIAPANHTKENHARKAREKALEELIHKYKQLRRRIEWQRTLGLAHQDDKILLEENAVDETALRAALSASVVSE